MVRCPSERGTLAPASSWSRSAPAGPSGAPLQMKEDRLSELNAVKYILLSVVTLHYLWSIQLRGVGMFTHNLCDSNAKFLPFSMFSTSFLSGPGEAAPWLWSPENMERYARLSYRNSFSISVTFGTEMSHSALFYHRSRSDSHMIKFLTWTDFPSVLSDCILSLFLPFSITSSCH